MSKVIVIEHCAECRHSYVDREKGKQFCYEMREEGVKYCPDEGLPDWCPLPDLSKKLQTLRFFMEGWNNCLNTITEEKE